MRQRSLPFLLVLCAGCAQASQWFVLMGDSGYPPADRVELDVSDIGPGGAIGQMKLRVTLAQPRTLETGERFQSYFSHITIDCPSSSIFHDDQTRYEQAEWKGRATFERFAQPRPMAFYGLQPDPKPRVLAAACAGARR